MSSDRPLVSVVVPTYNRATYLARALRSVLAQHHRDFEVVVVDDGSEDGTAAVASGFGDARIKYVRHAQNLGGSTARNTGIRESKGLLIALLDDDDEWLPSKLVRQLQRFREIRPSVGVVYSGVRTVSDASGEVLFDKPPTARGFVYLESLKRCVMHTSTALIRKACFDEVGGFDESFRGCQDRDMWIRLAEHTEFDYVPEILVRRYVHEGQLTHRLSLKIEAKEALFRKYRSALAAHPTVLAQYMRELGRLHCVGGYSVAGRSYFRRSARYDPVRAPLVFGHVLASRLAPRLHMQALNRLSFTRPGGVSQYY